MTEKESTNKQQKKLAEQIEKFDHRQILKRDKWKRRLKLFLKTCFILFILLLGSISIKFPYYFNN